jgi:dihydropteroate synthase
MGILNVTPDSFFDGGRYRQEEAILIRTEQMLEEGAAIIDIGAVSTRPGAKTIPIKEELLRLLPAIRAVRKYFPESVISADTFRASVAREAVDAGADMINDIGGGSLDPEMYSVMAKLQVPYVLMHLHGTPESMQESPLASNALKMVLSYFLEKIGLLKEAGVGSIILDPGFGFGKTVESNFELLSGLRSISELGYPVLVGLSRKSMINKVLGTKPEDALNGTTAANMIALMNGANFLRVHDVKYAVEAVKIYAYIRSAQQPIYEHPSRSQDR